jgi:hypothetical protein
MMGKRRTTKRVTVAEITSGKPCEKANRSRKYQTLDGTPAKALFKFPALGSKGSISEINSVVKKYNAKYSANLTMTDRRKKEATELRADKRIPNIANP